MVSQMSVGRLEQGSVTIFYKNLRCEIGVTWIDFVRREAGGGGVPFACSSGGVVKPADRHFCVRNCHRDESAVKAIGCRLTYSDAS